MRVDLRTLKPNPFRDLTVDPILDDPKILASIERHDFWGGSVCRRVPNGDIQIGAGHVRVRMAIQAGHTHADLFVSDTITDKGMVQIYAEENATQRGNTSPAICGSVAAAIRLILQNEFNGFAGTVEINSANIGAQARDGVGRDAILEILEGIPGYKDNTVRQQLVNIKTSGDYDRIVSEEIAKAQERLRIEEEARQRAEEARQEAERRAEAARQEAERQRLAVKAAAEEAARQEAERQRLAAEEAEQQAEADRAAAAEAEAQHAAAVEAGEAAINHQQAITNEAAERRAEDYGGDAAPFDFVGVSRWMSNASHIDTFRTMVLGNGLRCDLPKDQQAPLAKALVEHAASGGAEFTVAFIREHITALLLQLNTEQNRATRRDRQRLLRTDWNTKFGDMQREFSRHCRGLVSAAARLDELNQSRPRGVTLMMTNEFRNAVETAKRALALLEERRII